jgi:hypothetical protein
MAAPAFSAGFPALAGIPGRLQDDADSFKICLSLYLLPATYPDA